MGKVIMPQSSLYMRHLRTVKHIFIESVSSKDFGLSMLTLNVKRCDLKKVAPNCNFLKLFLCGTHFYESLVNLFSHAVLFTSSVYIGQPTLSLRNFFLHTQSSLNRITRHRRREQRLYRLPSTIHSSLVIQLRKLLQICHYFRNDNGCIST